MSDEEDEWVLLDLTEAIEQQNEAVRDLAERYEKPGARRPGFLSDAVAFVEENRAEGVYCPCCTQLVKVYRRKITSAMARILIAMYRDGGDDDGYMHVPRLRSRMNIEAAGGGDFSKCAYWGLVEEMPERREDGGRAGWWRLTEQGIAYVTRGLRIPKYAEVFDGKCLGYDQTQYADIRDALGTRFNYDDLMAGV